MIYVHRDWTTVPERERKALEAVAEALDKLTDKDARKQFIKDNADAWSAVRRYLSAMSYNKCWYSEASETVSRYQVDHFRPHGRSKQAERTLSPGYCWLAFDIDNLRVAGVLTNTQNREHSKETVGKGDWFPLVDPTTRATLENRDTSAEVIVLLDPTDPNDPPKLQFNDDGSVVPAVEKSDVLYARVLEAIRILGLEQSMLRGARRRTWRECGRKIQQYTRFARKPKEDRTPEENQTLEELGSELVAMARAESEFSAVARCCLISERLEGLVVRNELSPLAV